MTRQEILDEFNVDKGGRIRNPGKFEGEMLYVPHYYDLSLESGFDDEVVLGDESVAMKFFVSADDTKEFPELEGDKEIYLSWNDQGFVYEISKEEYEDFERESEAEAEEEMTDF